MADVGLSIAALAIIVVFSAIGGWIVFYSCKGFKCGKFTFKGCCGSVKIPPLLGMLTGGCIAM